MSKKNYFDEDKMKELAEIYLSYPPEIRKDECREIYSTIIKGAGDIVKGVIFTHKFMKFGVEYDELYQHGLMSCVTALEKFNPEYIIPKTGEKVKLFNYFSLVAKNALKYYTMQDKKHRDTTDIYNHYDGSFVEKNDDALVYNEQFACSRHISDMFVEMKRNTPPKYHGLVDLMQQYIQLTGEYNKRFYLRYCKSYGWTPHLVRKFLNELSGSKSTMYNTLK